MTGMRLPMGASIALLAVAIAPALAGDRELKTLTAASEVLAEFADARHGIPQHLLHEAGGVAILPHVVKAGLVVDGRFGRGVVLARQPNGVWSNPVFVTLEGMGVGGLAGVEATDLVLVFKNPHGVDRILQGNGKLTLGGDLTVAAGPLGRDAEVATDGHFKAEILSYSHSRGLFAGVSVEGAGLRVDHEANDLFYSSHFGRPALAQTNPAAGMVEGLRAELARFSAPPVVVVPAPVGIAPPPQPAYPPPPPSAYPPPPPSAYPPPPPIAPVPH